MILVVGQKARRSHTLTAEHVRTYAALTGDYNPLHFDAAFAHRTKFGRLVVQGGLTTGLLHALVAMDLPGPGTVFLSQNWKFTAPVYLGDTITAEAEVVSVRPTTAEHGTPCEASAGASAVRNSAPSSACARMWSFAIRAGSMTLPTTRAAARIAWPASRYRSSSSRIDRSVAPVTTRSNRSSTRRDAAPAAAMTA